MLVIAKLVRPLRCKPEPCPYGQIGYQLAVATPVRGDDQEHTREREREACDDRKPSW
jgi:hypothetical protein